MHSRQFPRECSRHWALFSGFLSRSLLRRSGATTNGPMWRSIVKRAHSEPSWSLPPLFRATGICTFGALIRRHIDRAATQEWPSATAEGTATLRFTPPLLAGTFQLTLALTPNSEGQKTAQREIATALETAFDARRQRYIIISQSHVNLVKWLCLFMQAAAALFAIAMIHCDNRIAAAITVGLFATGVAASVCPSPRTTGRSLARSQLGPALLQVMPDDSR